MLLNGMSKCAHTDQLKKHTVIQPEILFIFLNKTDEINGDWKVRVDFDKFHAYFEAKTIKEIKVFIYFLTCRVCYV